jgi:hypothetical protein
MLRKFADPTIRRLSTLVLCTVPDLTWPNLTWVAKSGLWLIPNTCGGLIYPPGANRTISNYNASVVNFYNATGSLARFESKKKYSALKNAVAYSNAGVVAVN